MLRIGRFIWLVFATAACSIDSRSLSVEGVSETAESAAGRGASGQPGESGPLPPPAGVDDMATPAAGSGGTASTLPVSGASSPSGQDGPATQPTALDPTPAVVPAPPFTAPLPTCLNPTVSFDTLFQLAQADLLQQSPADRIFIRYVSVTNRVDAGDCVEALEEQRAALIKALNMLSTSPVIAVPSAIDPERTIYRIDLRDFSWDRAIEVEGTSFVDVWEAIAAADPFAVPFTGVDADALTVGTGTTLPILFADQLLSVAMAAPLYSAIIGVDTSLPVGDFIRELGVNLAANLTSGQSLRAGTTASRISRRNRLVERDAIEVYSGVLWQVFELTSDTDTFAIQDLLGLPATDGEAIFSLPNGMLGFLIFDAAGTIVADSAILLDTNLANLRALSAVSCSNCHSVGFMPVVDEAKATALSAGLSSDETAQLQALYAEPDVFARAVAEDSATFQTTLRLTGLPTTGIDPVSQVFFRFDDDLTLAVAAGELGVTAAELSANLDLLQPGLAVLEGGVLGRDDFAAAYVASLCILSVPSDNQPDPAACEAALAAAP